MRLFRLPRRVGVPAALLLGMLALAPGAGGQPPAGGKSEVLKGEVRAGVHKVRLEAGKLYRVRVEANGFMPKVAIRPGGFTQLAGVPGQPGVPGVPGLPGGDPGSDVFEGIVSPKETREYEIVIVPNPDDDLGGQPLAYEATVVLVQTLLNEEDRTPQGGPRYMNGGVNVGPYKAYPVQLKARQLYVITLDMTQPGAGYDPFLVLEGPGGEVVASNDDANGLNSRIVYRAKQGGQYRVIASGLGNSSGAYRLRMISTAPDDGKAPAAPKKTKE